ncbi:GntR family transcriptional regulator [Fredinandcohnia onubensis]|uniref:GntR family transcriptional regulator n=1 Tax=Fredinandcohnia onubensis TaxID=1571209 RepID=UPI00211E626D|nr:GntR family transcriptional regulator [Fredinandcohnia onubensis]
MESLLAKDKIASILRNEIIKGNIKPGQKLLEKELCEQLGVSRTPLREAIRNLEVEGLIESIPNKGSRVRTMTIQDIKNVYELRIELEALATKKSVPYLIKEDLDSLFSIQEMLKTATKKATWGEVSELNKKFHNILVSKGDNNLLLSTIDQLHKVSVVISVSNFSIPGRSWNVIDEHSKVIEAVKEKDAELASILMRNHLEAARDSLLNYMSNME